MDSREDHDTEPQAGPHPEDETPLRAAEHHVLEEALAKHCGSRRELAEALGISERTLYRKLVAFGLSKRR